MNFPMDLEWIEGGQLYHAYRWVHGEPVYGPPSQGFVPNPYPPLHFLLLGLRGRLAGFGYAPARLLSVTYFLVASILLCWEVVLHARSRWEGLILGPLAFGTLGATTPILLGWFTLIRNDSLAFALAWGIAPPAPPYHPPS